ncbi:MAG TPA: class I SAM-dependent methyltransferase [Myxococcota bacterium]|nr:class I SAM-dependent methyltransferase [Myxococcota bacterium]
MFHPDGPSLVELVQQGLCSLEEGYDRIAPKFDLTPFRTPDEVVAVVAEAVGDVDDAIDICCGTGSALFYLRPHVRRRLVGLDLSSGMLDQARAHLRGAAGSVEAELVQGDVLHAPFSEEFDLVTCFGAFGHFTRDEEPLLVASVKELLRPGGRFAFVTHRELGYGEVRTWPYRAFNAAMLLRNAVIDPPFVMYYLGFTLERSTELLEADGFTVEVLEGALPAPLHNYVVVMATRR